jgi:hypothetical protein
MDYNQLPWVCFSVQKVEAIEEHSSGLVISLSVATGFNPWKDFGARRCPDGVCDLPAKGDWRNFAAVTFLLLTV